MLRKNSFTDKVTRCMAEGSPPGNQGEADAGKFFMSGDLYQMSALVGRKHSAGYEGAL